ncbi:MAG: hypothetical protein K0R28_2730 [Paenibacillus sp.]|nr:hypothetical protein [Paenibacillus sp.]
MRKSNRLMNAAKACRGSGAVLLLLLVFLLGACEAASERVAQEAESGGSLPGTPHRGREAQGNGGGGARDYVRYDPPVTLTTIQLRITGTKVRATMSDTILRLR